MKIGIITRYSELDILPTKFNLAQYAEAFILFLQPNADFKEFCEESSSLASRWTLLYSTNNQVYQSQR